jgi:hypothetical protein
MTLLESYVGRFAIQGKERFVVNFKIEGIETRFHLDSLASIYEKMRAVLPYWKFDQVHFIPSGDRTTTPPTEPIDEHEIKRLEDMCRESLPCALLPSPPHYMDWCA